jgi:hypothetical protein
VRTITFILVCSFAFAWLDWQTVHQTRWVHPEWKDWMHGHERLYANVTRPVEFVLCTPCLALKPLFYNAAMSVSASQEEQDAITHAPKMNERGFYHLVDRRYSWTFVGWFWWFLFWLPLSVLWWSILRHIQNRRSAHWR